MKTVFISLDTMGSSRLSALGGRVHTPNLDRLAESSALFANAFATDIPTQPSHTAVFTGRSGASTGIVSHFHPPAMLDERIAWLPSVFQAQGCRTGAVDHLFVMKEWFIRGYDDYLVPPGRSRSPAEVVNELAYDWLDEHHMEDFFLFVHFWDAHIPYVPPEPFRSEYAGALEQFEDPQVMDLLLSRPTYPLFKRNLYDYLDKIVSLEHIEALHYAEVAYLDHQLGLLFDRLERLGILDDTLIVIFGDHGEVMTEHDSWFDHAGLWDSVVHVPLIIRAPGLVPATEVQPMVALMDIMPTVLELQGLPVPEGATFEGRSLVPLMRGETDRHRDVIMLSECTWEAKRGVRTPDWKYIRCWDPGVYECPHVALYDLNQDPDEQTDVADAHPEVVAELGAVLDTWLAEQLDGRPDPMIEVITEGLPAVARLNGVIAEDAAAEAAAAAANDEAVIIDLSHAAEGGQQDPEAGERESRVG